MKKTYLAMLGFLVGLFGSGCSWQIKEIKGKSKFGPEFRDSGVTDRHVVRWTSLDQEFEFKWDNGWSTILSYRRRDTSEGEGGNDNRVLVGFSYPLWKRPEKPDVTAQRIQALEARLAQLEGAGQKHGDEQVAQRPQQPLAEGTSGTKLRETH